MAFARRAALLAEDLAEWQAIYHQQYMVDGEWGLYEPNIAVIAERDRQLKEMVQELQDVSVRLTALR